MIWSSFAVLRIRWFVKLAERCQFKDWLEGAAFGLLSKDMETVLDGFAGRCERDPTLGCYICTCRGKTENSYASSSNITDSPSVLE